MQRTRAAIVALLAWGTPSESTDEEKARASHTLFILSLCLIAMASFSLAQAWAYGWTGAAWTMGVEDLCLLTAVWFNRRGELEWATTIICFSELGCGLVVTSLFGAGFKDEGMLLFPLILVTAAILLNWRAYVRFAVLVVVSVTCAGLILAAGGVHAMYHTVFNLVNILLTTAVAAGLLARNLKRSVVQSREAEREIMALSERLINAQEEERARLARELHDDLSQQIAALSIGMSNLKRQIPPEQVEAREQSARIQQKLVQVAESIRRLSHELHPAVLEYSGLGAALRDYCSEFGLLTDIRVTCKTQGSFESVPFAVALCVYRITQEALQNEAKHARVGEAEVELTRTDGLLCLTVSDRGAGMQAKRAGLPASLGLVSIKERARLVKGTFRIQSRPNEGTTLGVRIPL
jgi:signal transduction histidine kinase